ncbi:tRNA (adenosine(37)-N6)-threonylcarbamoyltransferase complex ATPase subunit type 1 TsaE [Candidatus Saccharibacteria bacterium]|nr:tRNA (adenosine(37)-N6)-threonylcarbamoyltransferase complex ATPase subunit type 1 TsaE [Candidatus Saccharibacteria bacterium]
MSIDQKLSLSSQNSEQSLALGETLGSILEPGDVIEFVGDLGGGKTTFIKGIARGLGITQTVTSPTYNIQRSYEIPSGGSLEHYDLYRLGEDEILLQEMREVLMAGDAIVVVEWADHFRESLKDDRFTIEAHFVDENTRRYDIFGTGVSTQKRLAECRERLEDVR